MSRLLVLFAAVVCAAPTFAVAADDSFGRDVAPFLTRYCVECHQGEKPAAEFDLQPFHSEAAALSARPRWKRIWEMLHAREMPPPESPQPSEDERAAVADWIERMLATPDANGALNPGHVPPRRLNATEYNNTLYDLLGLQRRFTFYDPKRHGGMPEMVRYVLQRQFQEPLVALPPEPVAYGFDNVAEALNTPPFLLEKYLDAAKKLTDRDDVRQAFYRRSKRDAPTASADQEERGRAVVRSFTARAFRRPVNDAEAAPHVALYDQVRQAGGSMDDAIAVALQSILVSPQFLFRIERGVAAEDEHGVRPLDDFELASRLSYFLWSTMPDEELMRTARDGQLRDPEVLETQARRMLADPKAEEFVKNFTVQWLQIQNIRGHAPDVSVLPEAGRLKYLNEALMTETILLFGTIVAEDRSVLELVDADYTWLNATLGTLYDLDVARPGNPKPSGLEWYRYPLADRRRGGVLTSGAVLMTTSSPTQTNPVKRGKWVLEALLGQPPPPPLPNVPNLDATPVAAGGLPIREKLELHRSDAACASCHRRLDPLGLALEHYDAIGRWRDEEGPHPIDAAGELLDGTKFDGAVALKNVLVGPKRDDFVRCLTQHMLTYALGRPTDYYDLPSVQQIVKSAADDDYRLSTLVVEIVKSYPFRHLSRPVDAETPAASPGE